MRLNLFQSIVITSTGVLALGLVGCDKEMVLENVESRCRWEPGAMDTSAPHHRYVVDSIQFGNTPAAVSSHAMELDCTEPMRRDNQLGQVLATVYTQMGMEFDAVVGEMVEDGRIIHLLDVQAANLVDADGVGVRFFVGQDLDGDASDNFSGSEMFGIAPEPVSEAMLGSIVDEDMTAHYGRIPLQIALPGSDERYIMNLQATGIEARVVREDFIEARVGGALSEADVENELMPLIHSVLADIVEDECPDGACDPDSRAGLILQVLDADDDGMVLYQEFRENEVVEALLTPDVDIFDGDGRYNPGVDGIRDSLSLGVTITAVSATF